MAPGMSAITCPMHGIYNIGNIKANAMEFWYVDRLPGEPAIGVADVHIHPLEPISARITIAKSF